MYINVPDYEKNNRKQAKKCTVRSCFVNALIMCTCLIKALFGSVFICLHIISICNYESFFVKIKFEGKEPSDQVNCEYMYFLTEM